MSDETLGHQPRILHPGNLPSKSEGEIKTFLDRQKLRELVTKTPALQEMLKEVLQRKDTHSKSATQIKLTDAVNREVKNRLRLLRKCS